MTDKQNQNRGEAMHTVQLLIQKEGNRAVISGFLDDRYEILTDSAVQHADAYLVEDSVYPDVRAALQEVVAAERPVFRPVVLIQGPNSRPFVAEQNADEEGARSPVADVIEAPVRPPVLRRRLASLLGRRDQSQKLQRKMEQVERQRDALGVLNQMVRHDIRNDMSLVLGYAQQLSEHVAEEGADVLETVIASTEEAIELTTEARELTDLLLTADSEMGSIQLEEVVETELQAARDSNPEAAIEYRPPETDLTVTGDQMLSSVVRNLVTNAIRHNDAETPRVLVSITDTGESACLTVADNGPGVPDEFKENIFQRGEKREESPGTGIGLYLVSAIVDRYGGEVHVADSELGGAEFSIELALAE